MKVASFFSGCGGLDLGFEQAGFDVVWANEFDSSIHDTYRLNHPKTTLCTKDVREVTAADLPNVDGFYRRIDFHFPKPTNTQPITLRQALSGDIDSLANHDVYMGEYSTRYMSRNRVRSWEEPSFTIPATATNVPIHPQAPKMIRLSYDKPWFFSKWE